MTNQNPNSNQNPISKIPTSNRRIFTTAFVVGIMAIFAFVFLIRSSDSNPKQYVDKAVMQDVPDPAKVFDAPLSKASLYYIDLEKFGSNTTDPQSIGCGDAVVAYEIPVGDLFATTKADATTYVLGQLFDNTVFEGLEKLNPSKATQPYNVLAGSKITIKTIKDIPGQYEVRLVGTPKIGGVCDGPRVVAQIQKTLDAVYAPSTVAVFLNGKPLAEAFSGR